MAITLTMLIVEMLENNTGKNNLKEKKGPATVNIWYLSLQSLSQAGVFLSITGLS